MKSSQEDLPSSHFFSFEEIFFKVTVQNFRSSFYVISLASENSCCLSANQNPELRCVICIGLTLFAPLLHLTCTALSQSESSNFFIFIIKLQIMSLAY